MIAGGLALWVGGSLALDLAPRLAAEAFPVRYHERALAPLRPALRAGDRVALLMPEDDLGAWYATQYALAPATVIRERPRDCLEGAPADCAVGATHLLVVGGSGTERAALAARLGFVPVASSARVLLARRAP